MEAKKFFVCVTMLCLGLSVFATMSAVLHADPPNAEFCGDVCPGFAAAFGIPLGECMSGCVVCMNDGDNLPTCICKQTRTVLGEEKFKEEFGTFGNCVNNPPL